MNKLIIYPLLIMAVLAFFNQIYVHTQTPIEPLTPTLTYNHTLEGQTGTLGENGSSNTISTNPETTQFNIDDISGYIAIIIGVVILGTVIGISALGSGLSSRAQKIIFNAVVCYGLWGICSVLVLSRLTEIPIFGTILWLFMTMVFTLGFFKSVNEGYQ